MKAVNYHFYGSDADVKRLAEEYEFLGRHVVIEPGHLTVLALPPKKVKKKVVDDKRKGRVSETRGSGDDRPTRKTDRQRSR